MILPLATYFGVSSDEMLGLDTLRNKEKINNFLNEYNRLNNLGKVKEGFNLISVAYNEFPNDFSIIQKYISSLTYDPYCKNYQGIAKHEEELMKLCNYVLDECNIDEVRYSALSIISSIYREKGNIDKALEYANRFPKSTCAELECENIFDIGTEQWWYWVRKNIVNLTEKLQFKIRNCALYSNKSPEAKIKLLQKAVDLIKLVYDDNDYGFSNLHLCELYIWIANQYIELKDWENAAKFLDFGLSYVKQYDEIPKVYIHTSIVFWIRRKFTVVMRGTQ